MHKGNLTEFKNTDCCFRNMRQIQKKMIIMSVGLHQNAGCNLRVIASAFLFAYLGFFFFPHETHGLGVHYSRSKDWDRASGNGTAGKKKWRRLNSNLRVRILPQRSSYAKV